VSEALARTFVEPSLAAADPSEAETPRSWFAIWTHSQCETLVEDGLRAKRLEVFLPRVRVPSRRRDRRRTLLQPLFPGYVFVSVAPTRRACIAVASTDGVVRMIGERWDLPSPIAEDEIEAVRRIVAYGERVGSVPWIKVGDRVRVIGGALAGLEGYVQEQKAGRATLVVRLDLLQRSVGVEIAADLVERV